MGCRQHHHRGAHRPGPDSQIEGRRGSGNCGVSPQQDRSLGTDSWCYLCSVLSSTPTSSTYLWIIPAPGSRTRLLKASFSDGTQKSSWISCFGSSLKIFFSLTQVFV